MDQEVSREKRAAGLKLRGVWHNSWFTVPVLLFFACGLALLMSTPHGSEIVFFNDCRNEPMNSIFRFFTRLGEAPVFFIAAIVAAFFRYRFALLIAMTGLLTIPVSYYTKDIIGEDRPITYFERTGQRETLVLVPGVRMNSGQNSFPSGHTTAAFNLYAMITVFFTGRYRRLGLLTAFTAMAVGLSRIFLAQHFLSDVLAGAGLGLLLSWLVFRVGNWLPASWTGLDRGLLSVG